MKLTALLIVFVAARGTSVDAVAVQCPDVANGNVVIAHQFECSSFYLCDGSPKPSFLLRCPTGMLFGEEGTMGTGVAGGGCVQDAECRPQIDVTAVPATRGARALPPVDTPGDYRNYTVHLRNPANCTQFYRYEGDNEPQLFECPTGHGFDPVLESCDSKVKCRSPSTCRQGVSPPVCPPNNDQLVHLPHPTDCTKFYKCNWGNPILFDCPDQLHFNPKSQVCDWPRNVPCDRCPPGDRTDGEPDEDVPDGEVTDYDEPKGEPTGGEGRIDARFGRQDGSRTLSSGTRGGQTAPGQGRLPERGSGQSAGYASKGGHAGDRQNKGQTTATGVQPKYREQTDNQGYQPLNQGYQPPSQGSQPSSQGYQPPSQGYQPSSQGYQPPSQGSQPPSQGYQPPVRSYQPTNRQQGYPSAGQGHQTTNQNYQPNSQGRQPGTRQQPNQGYQEPTREYQPDYRQQPGQEQQPSDDSWGHASQDRTQPGQASRSLQGHRDHGSNTQIRQTVDGYPIYQTDAANPPRSQNQPTAPAPRSQHQPSTVPPRSEYQPRPTPPVRRYLTAPQDNQGGTGRVGQYQPAITMAPGGRHQPEDQSQAGARSDGQWQPGSRPDGQSHGEPRWPDGERPAPGPRVQMKPTSGVGGKPQYYQLDEQEQSIDTDSRQPYETQGRQSYGGQGHQPTDGQDRQPYNAQGRQPTEAQGRQPNDSQGRQWYDSQGRLLTVAQGRQPTGLQPTPKPSQPNASSQSPPSRDFHSVRVYHADSRTTWPPAGARTGQSTTPRYRQDGYQPRDPYQPLDQDTEQGPDSGIEQVSYSADHHDPDEQLYGSTAQDQTANQRGGTAQQRSTTPQPASYSARAHQRPEGGKYAATPQPEESNDYNDDTSQPRTRSVDSQLPGLSDLRTHPVGSNAARSSELRAEPPRPVYQHVMRIPTPNELGRKA